MLHDSETGPLKTENQHCHLSQITMVRWMCSVKLNTLPSTEFSVQLGLEDINSIGAYMTVWS